MKSYNQQFQENYAPVEVPANNKDGFRIKYVYIGSWYMWEVSPEKRQRDKLVIGSLWLLELACYLAAGLIPSGLSTEQLVSALGLITLIPLAFETYGAFSFLFLKERITKPDFNRVRLYLGAASVIRTALLFLTAGCSVVTAIMNKLSGSSLITILGFALSAVFCGLLSYHFLHIPYTSEKNDTMDRIVDDKLEDAEL